jgi:predicted Zn-ribbon and HTH transcriptional regulator
MNLKPGMNGVAGPAGNRERLYRCEHCGAVFMKAPLLPVLPVKCPRCGSLKTGEDRRACN